MVKARWYDTGPGHELLAFSEWTLDGYPWSGFCVRISNFGLLKDRRQSYGFWVTWLPTAFSHRDAIRCMTTWAFWGELDGGCITEPDAPRQESILTYSKDPKVRCTTTGPAMVVSATKANVRHFYTLMAVTRNTWFPHEAPLMTTPVTLGSWRQQWHFANTSRELYMRPCHITTGTGCDTGLHHSTTTLREHRLLNPMNSETEMNTLLARRNNKKSWTTVVHGALQLWTIKCFNTKLRKSVDMHIILCRTNNSA